MSVVKSGNQSDVLRKQHAISKYVTTHVTNTNHGEILGLSVYTKLKEVTLNRFPSALGCNTHNLVVVTNRSTGGKRIAHPETTIN